MDEAFRSGLLDKQSTKPTKETTLAKREDVDIIVATASLYTMTMRSHACCSGTRA